MAGEDFMRSFSTCFAVLGLKLLFGQKQVTMGSVVLLGAISAAIASAWTGGGGAWIEINVADVLNSSLRDNAAMLGAAGQQSQGLLYSLMCKLGALPSTLAGQCIDGSEEQDRVEL